MYIHQCLICPSVGQEKQDQDGCALKSSSKGRCIERRMLKMRNLSVAIEYINLDTRY